MPPFNSLSARYEPKRGLLGDHMYDLLITNARIVDGTGAPAFHGSIAITDGVIVGVGSVSGPARRTIDAEGNLVTPGFVDIHTHFDGQVCWDKQVTPVAGTASPRSSWGTAASASPRCVPARKTRWCS